MVCKICGRQTHYCTSCGYDAGLHPLSEGCCGWECLRAADGDPGEWEWPEVRAWRRG